MARRNNEAKIRFTAETGGFNDAIKQSNTRMAELRAELQLNEAQMRTNGESIEGLENSQRILVEQMNVAHDKVEALNEKLAVATRIYGENSEEVARLRIQLYNAQTAEERIVQSIQACNDRLQAQREATEATEEAHESLTDKIKRQQSELDNLKEEYAEIVASGREASEEAQTLARSIEELSGDLRNNREAMSNASRMADELDRSLEEIEESADDAGDGFTVFGGMLADLASSAIQGAIGKIGEFVGYLTELPNEMLEISQDMATLTTSFHNVGMSSETAKDTWKELYAVFGEDDRAVEASNHIARMAKDQQDLNDWVTITTGVFATYQDSLPVEGLAEASAETAKTGQVTGVLADALNWSSEASKMFADYMSDDVVTAEDAFNVALSECTTEQERQALITDTLTKLYGESADTYRDTVNAQMEAKEATAEQILAEVSLANAISPVTTKFNELKTSLLTGALPAVEKVSGAMIDALDWMKEHPVLMKSIAVTVGVLATALGILTGVVVAYTIAQWAMNSAILANPITWVIVGIIAVIAVLAGVIVAIVSYWDEIVIAVKNAGASIMTALQTAWDWMTTLFGTLASWVNINVIQPVVAFFTGLWTKLQEIWNTIVNVVQVAFMLIGSVISGAIQIITLPFMLIWENCKTYVFEAWEWIKEKVTAGINAVKNVVSSVMEAVKSVFTTAWNAIKDALSPVLEGIKNTVSTAWNSVSTATSTVFNAVKTTASNVWNGIKTTVSGVVNGIKNTVSGAWNTVKSTTTSAFNGIKSTASSVWNGIKNAITKPIEDAKTKIKGVVDSIKGFFNKLDIQFPKIKMPHFSIKGSFSLDPPSVPKLGIDWYKDGGIFTKPTIFSTSSGLKGVGEAGAEAVLPIDRLEGYIAGAIERTMQVADVQALADAIGDLASRPIMLNVNGKNFATATANDTDNVNGLRSTFKSRGLVLG